MDRIRLEMEKRIPEREGTKQSLLSAYVSDGQ